MLMPHSEAEESFVYPEIRRYEPEETAEVHDGTAEHHHIEQLMRELLSEDPDGPGYDGKLAAMVAELRHHVEEEEEDLLPVLSEKRAGSGREWLEPARRPRNLPPAHTRGADQGSSVLVDHELDLASDNSSLGS
jgi:hemerythrin superfamily protein